MIKPNCIHENFMLSCPGCDTEIFMKTKAEERLIKQALALNEDYPEDYYPPFSKAVAAVLKERKKK